MDEWRGGGPRLTFLEGLELGIPFGNNFHGSCFSHNLAVAGGDKGERRGRHDTVIGCVRIVRFNELRPAGVIPGSLLVLPVHVVVCDTFLFLFFSFVVCRLSFVLLVAVLRGYGWWLFIPFRPTLAEKAVDIGGKE